MTARIASIIATVPDALAVQLWCVGDSIFAALVDKPSPAIEGTTVIVTPEQEQTVFDRLLAQGQQVQRDRDEQEGLDAVLREHTEAIRFNDSNANERI